MVCFLSLAAQHDVKIYRLIVILAKWAIKDTIAIEILTKSFQAKLLRASLVGAVNSGLRFWLFWTQGFVRFR